MKLELTDRQAAAKATLEAALESGNLAEIIMVTEWDDVTRENGWNIDDIGVQDVVDSPLVNAYDRDGDCYFATDNNGCEMVMKQYGDDVATLTF